MLLSRRIVITGIGMVTPLGLDTKSTWAALLNGESGIRPIEDFDVSAFPCQFGGTILNFQLASFNTKHIQKMDWFIKYGLQAAKEAIIDAGLLHHAFDPTRVGVSIGSGMGGLSSIEKQHQHLLNGNGSYHASTVSPFFIPSMLMSMLSGLCAIEYNFQGPNFSLSSACATGAHNIISGVCCITEKKADIMIVGGAEKSITPLSLAGFSASRALSTRNASPIKASRPWDQHRDGFVLSDGASILALECYEHAKARGAHIYGEIIGMGMSADSYDMTLPEPKGKGAIMAMEAALTEGSISPKEVDYINAHATSTIKGDMVEIKAIQSIWRHEISRLKISGTKSMTGHLLGAAGALEAAFCLLALQDQIAPPTINLDHSEPECTDLNLVPHHAQPGKIRVALSNSFGFGGTNTTLLFRKM